MSDLIRLRVAEVEFEVKRFSVREQLSGLWNISALVLADDPNLAFDSLVDRGAAFMLRRPGRRVATRVWSGICSEITHLSSETKGLSKYSLNLVPELWRLGLRRNSRVFQHASLPKIALHLLEDWGFKEGSNLIVRNVELDDKKRFPDCEYRVQYEESDYAFLCRTLEEAGITFYFEYTNEWDGKGRDVTRLVIDGEPQEASAGSSEEEGAAEPGAAEPGAAEEAGGEEEQQGKKLLGPFPYVGSTPQARHGDTRDFIANASATRYTKPGAVTLIDHDFRLALGRRTSQKDKLAPPPDGGGDPTEAKYEQLAYSPGELHGETSRSEGNQWHDDKDARAKDALIGIRIDRVVLQFDTNALDATPGSVLAMDASLGSHPRKELKAGRRHLVVETQLDGDTMGEWSMRCHAVSADETFRPPRLTPKPRILGLQSALVVGPKTDATEQVYSDKYGRVRVQFHWDRQHKYGAPLSQTESKNLEILGSCWVRTSTPWAGRGYGFVAIPRVGHEVVVSFLDGDPDYPLIVGSLYNGVNMPPYPLADDGAAAPGQTITGLKSNSSHGGQGFNEFYLDDKKGQENFHIQAEKTMTKVVKQSESVDVGSARSTRIGKNDKLDVGEQYVLTVGKENGITVGANKVIILQVGGPEGSTITLAGPHIYLNAKGELHIHASGKLDLSSTAEINIDGPKVNINCGSPHAATPMVHPQVQTAGAPAPGGRIQPGLKPDGDGNAPMPAPAGEIGNDVTLAPSSPREGVDVPGVPSMDDVSDGADALRAEMPSPASLGGAMAGVAGQASQLAGQAGQAAQAAGQSLGARLAPQTGAALGGALATSLISGANPQQALKGALRGVASDVASNAASSLVGGGVAGSVAGTVASVGLSTTMTGGKVGPALRNAVAGNLGSKAGELAGSVVQPPAAPPATAAPPRVAAPPAVAAPPPAKPPREGT